MCLFSLFFSCPLRTEMLAWAIRMDARVERRRIAGLGKLQTAWFPFLMPTSSALPYLAAVVLTRVLPEPTGGLVAEPPSPQVDLTKRRPLSKRDEDKMNTVIRMLSQ